MACALQDPVARAFAAGHHSLQRHAGGHIALRDDELLGIHVEIILSVCHDAVKELDQGLAGSFARILQNTGCNSGVLATDQIEDDLDLARGDADEAFSSSCFHC